ncbi:MULTISPECIES: EamA family transporter [unclassified Polaromonas]|uniref:EamA family transporter n=1 Tax=unclassified Polaromonas TaxID=2638319 RepID=UPI000F0993D6|nr:MULTISPECIES: EamA family transporter [unclassified Polaromonas]AYQ28448.1 EamA family transporter [Polaromonas sp. SP1]QGJ20432.1 EamA family transporter [Polaromonas sp. Pch-P]
MSPGALALVLLAGLIHASWNIAAKKAGGDSRFAAFTGLVLLVAWAPLGIWFGIAELPRWGWPEWLLLCASALLHTVYYIVLLRGYRKADLTVVYPLARGSGPLLSSLAAIVLLGEQISALGVAGIAGVVGGVFLVAGGPGLWRASHDPAQRQRVRKGMVYGLLSGAFIAGYTVVDGYAVKILLMSPILVDYMGSLLRMVVLAPALLRDPAETRVVWKRQWKYAVFVGVVSPVSYVLVLYAMQTAPLSHVAPAREVSMLFAALLGGHLLGEGDRALRLAGAACIAAGVMALALG